MNTIKHIHLYITLVFISFSTSVQIFVKFFKLGQNGTDNNNKHFVSGTQETNLSFV